ncbi:MAG: winged helix-turn-helix transcriptional regulator [Candidatus Hodarchaeales archaeon]|jgi:DNA-binding Lrp family transcriptional regulator
MISPEDYQIILLLESDPLMPYSKLADELGVSWPTAKKRLADLKARGVIRTPVALVNPQVLGLRRLSVIWSVQTIDDLIRLEKLCDAHPYTIYRSRGYGNDYILFSQFNIPPETIPLMNEFNDLLVEKRYCDKATILLSSGVRTESFADLSRFNLSSNKWNFDWDKWFELYQSQSEIFSSPNQTPLIDLKKWKPIDFNILRELTKDPEIKQSELSQKFNLSRTSTHHSYTTVFNNLISSVQARFDRIMFNQVNTRLFWIPKVKESKLYKFFNLINNHHLPFRIGLDILQGNGLLLWGISLPTFHEHQLALTLWRLFQTFNSYTLDTSFDRSMIYWFYPDNFDFETKYWKIDREYVVNQPLADIQ